VNGHSTISSAIGDDTIEFELTPEQLQELTQAAESAEAVAPAQISAVTGSGLMPPAIAPRRRAPIAKMTAAIIAYVAFAWWSASQLAGQPRPPVTATAQPPFVMPRPALVTSAPNPTVRVINPFDATEVFEFPAGTSAVEGRDKVAQILLERARERQGQWEHIKPVPKVRTASL
jgi:hypothetical protein